MKGVSSSLSRMKTNFPRFLSYFDMQIFLYFSVIICSSCFWSVTPVLVNLAFCCGLRTTLTPRATSAPLVSTSRLEPLNWTAKPSSCRFGILLAKKDLEQSHPGKFCSQCPLHWELPLFSCFNPEFLVQNNRISFLHSWYDEYFQEYRLLKNICYSFIFLTVIIVGHMVSLWCTTWQTRSPLTTSNSGFKKSTDMPARPLISCWLATNVIWPPKRS